MGERTVALPKAVRIPKRVGTGQKKLRFKEMTQYCIDTVHPLELLKTVPPEVQIVRMGVYFGNPYALRRKVAVPTPLKRLGMTYMRVPAALPEGEAIFEGISRAAIAKNIKEIIKAMPCDETKITCEKLLLQHEGIRGFFTAVTKEIRPNEEDQRKKLRVMGLNSTSSKDEADTNALVRAISAKKYECKIDVIPVRTIICSSVK